MPWKHTKRPPREIWGVGVQHRPDDISRLSRQGVTDVSDRVMTSSGEIIPEMPPNEFYSLNTARRIREFRQTLTNTVVNLQFDSICVGVEIINDDASASITVAFNGDVAAPAVDGGSLVNSSEIKPKENRYYNLHTDKMSIRTTGTGVEVRGTVLLP